MDNLLSMEDLADVFSALDNMPESDEPDAPMSAEELASMRRYEEIIKKHQN